MLHIMFLKFNFCNLFDIRKTHEKKQIFFKMKKKAPRFIEHLTSSLKS